MKVLFFCDKNIFYIFGILGPFLGILNYSKSYPYLAAVLNEKPNETPIFEESKAKDYIF